MKNNNEYEFGSVQEAKDFAELQRSNGKRAENQIRAPNSYTVVVWG